MINTWELLNFGSPSARNPQLAFVSDADPVGDGHRIDRLTLPPSLLIRGGAMDGPGPRALVPEFPELTITIIAKDPPCP